MVKLDKYFMSPSEWFVEGVGIKDLNCFIRLLVFTICAASVAFICALLVMHFVTWQVPSFSVIRAAFTAPTILAASLFRYRLQEVGDD